MIQECNWLKKSFYPFFSAHILNWTTDGSKLSHYSALIFLFNCRFSRERFHEALGFSRVSCTHKECFASSCDSNAFNVCSRRELARLANVLHFCGWMYCFLSSNICLLFWVSVTLSFGKIWKCLEMYQNFKRSTMWRHFSLDWHFLISFVLHSRTLKNVDDFHAKIAFDRIIESCRISLYLFDCLTCQ